MARVSKEYSSALFSLASEYGCEKQISEDLGTLKSAFLENPELMGVLVSPKIPKSERLGVLEKAFKPYLSEYAFSFVCILCENCDLDSLFDCIEEYDRLFNDDKNIVDITVTSAVALTDTQKQRLEDACKKKFKCEITVSYTVDSSVIGGVKLETADMKLDGTVSSRINVIKEEVLDK